VRMYKYSEVKSCYIKDKIKGRPWSDTRYRYYVDDLIRLEEAILKVDFSEFIQVYMAEKEDYTGQVLRQFGVEGETYESGLQGTEYPVDYTDLGTGYYKLEDFEALLKELKPEDYQIYLEWKREWKAGKDREKFEEETEEWVKAGGLPE